MHRLLFALLLASVPSVASAQIVLTGEVDDADGVDYFVLPFEVPEGTVEIEVRHDDLSADNILDWGLLSPSGFRGYGGGNTEPAIVGIEASSRSYLTGPIEAGTWYVYVGEAKLEVLPASYRVEIDLRTEATLPPQPERSTYAAAEPLEVGLRWYAGDFHVHSRESGDASPTIDEIAEVAEERGLDFVMLSEHNTTSQMDFLADAQARHPSVLLIPGIEVTTYEGHFMSLGGTRWIDHRLGVDGRTLDDVADEVHDDGALFTVNHPALSIGDACIGCGFTGSVAFDAIDGMEIQTGAYSVTGRLFYGRVIERWETLISMGHHVVAIGGSDDHRAGTGTGTFDSPIGSPTTMVLAEELSVAGLMEGVRLGRTVVRLEGNEDATFEFSSPDLPDDSDTIVADYTTLRFHVRNAVLGALLVIVRDGERVVELNATGVERMIEVPLVASENEDAIRAELWRGVTPLAVSSHVFLRPLTEGGGDAGPRDAGSPPDAGVPEPSSGCSCRASTRATPSLALAALALLVVVARRRRSPSRRRSPRSEPDREMARSASIYSDVDIENPVQHR